MIFPILRGIPAFFKAPMTWILVLINTLVLVWSSVQGRTLDARMDKIMSNDFFIETQGRIYTKYIEENGWATPSPMLRTLADQSSNGNLDQTKLLGELAFRDQRFMAEAPHFNVLTDVVAQNSWKQSILQLKQLEAVHPSYIFGLSASDTGFTKWITYIFAHGGFWHYFGNMIFLVIFGAALESCVGSLGLLVVFMLTGLFGAGSFLLLSGPTTAPLIGASGAISGVMAVYCLLNIKKPIRFFYWIFLPTKDSMGFVYLPAWIAMALWMVTDLAGYLGTLPLLGGVAHSAHLGGEISGALIVLILWCLKHKNKDEGPEEIPQAWTLFPFRLDYYGESWSSEGAKPRRIVFSVTTRGSIN